MITTYTDKYKEQIIDLILSIQVEEYGLDLSVEDQPDLLDIPSFYQSRGDFWLALEGEKVVGTIGLFVINGNCGVLRKMFVHQDYRGGGRGIAKDLLETLTVWSKDNNLSTVTLGTTDRYLAAHRFYEKNGFIKISIPELPEGFPRMEVDNIFYQYSL